MASPMTAMPVAAPIVATIRQTFTSDHSQPRCEACFCARRKRRVAVGIGSGFNVATIAKPREPTGRRPPESSMQTPKSGQSHVEPAAGKLALWAGLPELQEGEAE